MLSWFSCKEYTRRVCQDLDHGLPWSERPGMWFHHLLCLFCRRAARQLRVVHAALERLQEETFEDELAVADTLTLSLERSQRIQEALERDTKRG